MHKDLHLSAVSWSDHGSAYHHNALPAGSMLMEYRLASVLGAGGFGITYLARDTNLEKDVAIKEYLPGSVAVRAPDQSVRPTNPSLQDDYKWGLDRFIQESRTLAKFGHANIVRVNRFFEANGTGYMVMDYEDGEPLKEFLKRSPFPPEATLKKLLAPLLDGLEKVHAPASCIGDIKPDNIFVRKTADRCSSISAPRARRSAARRKRSRPSCRRLRALRAVHYQCRARAVVGHLLVERRAVLSRSPARRRPMRLHG
jgi:serine/threonine protein kinase